MYEVTKLMKLNIMIYDIKCGLSIFYERMKPIKGKWITTNKR